MIAKLIVGVRTTLETKIQSRSRKRVCMCSLPEDVLHNDDHIYGFCPVCGEKLWKTVFDITVESFVYDFLNYYDNLIENSVHELDNGETIIGEIIGVADDFPERIPNNYLKQCGNLYKLFDIESTKNLVMALEHKGITNLQIWLASTEKE